MKIKELTLKLNEAAPAQFVPTHFGGPGGFNLIMHAADGNLYFQKPIEGGTGKETVRWNGNPTGEGFFGKWNPATIKGTIQNGNKIPYPQGQNFTNAPANQVGRAPAQAQAARPITGNSYDQGLLRRGSKGEGIKELQRRLGMPEDEIDGMFGPNTEAFVRQFQRKNNIKIDGIVGPETRAALEPNNNQGMAAPSTQSSEPEAWLSDGGASLEPGMPITDAMKPYLPNNQVGNLSPNLIDMIRRQLGTDTTTSTDDGQAGTANTGTADDGQAGTANTGPADDDQAGTANTGPADDDQADDATQDDADDDQADDATQDDADSIDIDAAPDVQDNPNGVVDAETIKSRLSPDAQEKFDDQMQEFDGDLLGMLIDAKRQADDTMQQYRWKLFYAEVFGIVAGSGFPRRNITDVPSKGIIDISTIPDRRPGSTVPRRGFVAAAPGADDYDAALGQIRYKTIDDMEESRILDLAGVKMKKQVNEANITISGADANEVSQILRMMQLAGADGAKEVGIDDMNPKPMPMPMPSSGGCGSEPSMADTIKMISKEDEIDEEGYDDGGFGSASTEPDEVYMNHTSAGYPEGDDLHKSKKSYKPANGGDNAMNVESELKAKLWDALNEIKDRDAYNASQQSSAKVTLPKAPWEKDHDADDDEKPDYADLDGDGNEKEAMKDAAKDKKAKAAAKK